MFTIYVKDGDIDRGDWRNIFIFNEDEKTKTTRLITSERGRIDFSNDVSELVLENAVATTLTGPAGDEKIDSERIGEVRYAVRTKRAESVERLNTSELTPEELGLSELSAFARSKEGSDRIEAQLLWQRRVMLSITPLIFSIFGAAFVLRYNRASRGFAVLAALFALIGYYLLAFFGEQMARTGKMNVYVAGVFPIAFSAAAILWLNLGTRFYFAERLADPVNAVFANFFGKLRPRRATSFLRDVTTGIRDFDLVLDLTKYFVYSLAFLTSVFLIFTAFELWKFAGTFENGISLLLKYLFYLTPFIYIQLAPSSLMIATLATYVIKSRQNEIVTWTAAGQSVYRLLLPCLIFMIFIGFVNWQIQERVMPDANKIQDDIRATLRNRGIQKEPALHWVAENDRILSFKPGRFASDNESGNDLCRPLCRVTSLSVYDFGSDRRGLQSLYRASEARWESGKLILQGPVAIVKNENDRVVRSVENSVQLAEEKNPFGSASKKPSHLTADEIKAQLVKSESEVEQRSFTVALERRYTTPFLPFTIALVTAPFALSLSRKGKAATIGYAVGLWLIFMGFTSAFDQLGIGGALSPQVAVWGPLVIFSMLGILLLSRIRT